jgi:hypothetical protein
MPYVLLYLTQWTYPSTLDNVTVLIHCVYTYFCSTVLRENIYVLMDYGTQTQICQDLTK